MYNPRKASQIVAFFALKTAQKRISVLKAVKLVYLADRENIARCGFPLLEERRVSMPLGPVNSYTYNHIKGEVFPKYDGGWSEFVADRADHNVGLASDSMSIDDLDELSDADVATLEAVWAKFGDMTQWELVEYAHDKANVPEWEDPKETGQNSKTIELEKMLAVIGVPFHKEHAAEMESAGSAVRFLKGL
ncbi:Panacea domain-containing protein [uncultured Roseovarius sp.]|uniref:Panacea domain-containing protein n=1 Tax=uncultured Roseovarius sp. TaxID=293344 RepID=UPI000C621E03|nr:hypothetical protein [Roseovarius sp.]MBD11415.1 hypothetical protein [Roseovarius sp.]|tara:strand:+ start:834 stop:1406 length:573 start_codon:yes stop_codon:yes gene_type:complete